VGTSGPAGLWQGSRADVSMLRAAAAAAAARASCSASRNCRKCAIASVSKAPPRASRSAHDVAVSEQQILERELRVLAALERVEVRDVGVARDLRRARVVKRCWKNQKHRCLSLVVAPRRGVPKVGTRGRNELVVKPNPCVPATAERKPRASKLRIPSSHMPVSVHTTGCDRHQHKRGAAASFASAGF
jgi:hypothetical protein